MSTVASHPLSVISKTVALTPNMAGKRLRFSNIPQSTPIQVLFGTVDIDWNQYDGIRFFITNTPTRQTPGSTLLSGLPGALNIVCDAALAPYLCMYGADPVSVINNTTITVATLQPGQTAEISYSSSDGVWDIFIQGGGGSSAPSVLLVSGSERIYSDILANYRASSAGVPLFRSTGYNLMPTYTPSDVISNLAGVDYNNNIPAIEVTPKTNTSITHQVYKVTVSMNASMNTTTPTFNTTDMNYGTVLSFANGLGMYNYQLPISVHTLSQAVTVTAGVASPPITNLSWSDTFFIDFTYPGYADVSYGAGQMTIDIWMQTPSGSLPSTLLYGQVNASVEVEYVGDVSNASAY